MIASKPHLVTVTRKGGCIVVYVDAYELFAFRPTRWQRLVSWIRRRGWSMSGWVASHDDGLIIDEVTVFDRVRVPSRYEVGIGREPGLIAYWPLDELSR